jgi:hypothetical protein
LAVLLVSILAAGCISSQSRSEVETTLGRAAAVVPGISKQRRLVAIHAETKMEAWAFLAEAKSGPDASPMSRHLGNQFARGERYRLDIVVGGIYPSLSDQVLVNALEMNSTRQLRGLRVVLVSKNEPSEALRKAAKKTRARLVFVRTP